MITPFRQATLFVETRFDRVEPDLEQVRRLLGLREDRDSHRRWFDVMDELLTTLPRLLRLRTVYRIDSVRRLESMVLMALKANAASRPRP